MRLLGCILAGLLLQACFSTAPRAHPDVDADTPPDTTDVPDMPDVPPDGELPTGVCPWGWDCRVLIPPSFTGVDALFVIDNSMDMPGYQDELVKQFQILASLLLDPEVNPGTGLPDDWPITDVHIGVISTDMGTGGYEVSTCRDPIDGDDGILLHEPMGDGCVPAYPMFLFYEEGSPDPGGIGELVADFGCIARLGDEGCGFEQQLEAALKALTTHSELGRPNDGFLRPDSIAMIFWISTENDCSASSPDLYDIDNPEYGPAGLRCFAFSEELHPTARYIEGFAGLGATRPLLLGMLVGVPVDEDRCNTIGSNLTFCLDVPEMRESIDSAFGDRLRTVCTASPGDAFPGRRFVELARAFGPRSYVHSICDTDYTPAFENLASAVSTITHEACAPTHLSLTKDPSDRCLCHSDCHVLHVLPDSGDCPPGMWEWDADGDTIPNQVRSDGRNVSACEVPHAGTRLSACSEPCDEIHQRHSPGSAGWYYSHSDTGIACPTLSYTPGFEPPPGSTTLVLCP